MAKTEISTYNTEDNELTKILKELDESVEEMNKGIKCIESDCEGQFVEALSTFNNTMLTLLQDTYIGIDKMLKTEEENYRNKYNKEDN